MLFEGLSLWFKIFLAFTAILSAIVLPYKIDTAIKKREGTKKTWLVIMTLIWIGFWQSVGEEWMRWMFATDLLVIICLLVWRRTIAPHMEFMTVTEVAAFIDKQCHDKRVSYLEFRAVPMNGLILFIHRKRALWVKRVICIEGDNCPQCLIESELKRRLDNDIAEKVIADYRKNIAMGMACSVDLPVNATQFSIRLAVGVPAPFVAYCELHKAPVR